MTSERPARAREMRESSPRPFPQPLALQTEHDTSLPMHATEPSPPVKAPPQTSPFIEPDVSKTRRMRARMSAGGYAKFASESSFEEWQPGSFEATEPNSMRPSPSLSRPSWHARR